MKPFTREELFRAKAERRARLAALSFEGKVLIMEKLQAMGHAMRAARGQRFKGECTDHAL